MDIREIRYFEAVARHLHFTRAAEELCVAQPALSAQIRRLEVELRASLFERTSRNVSLTDAGEALLPAARRVLADIDEAHRRLQDVVDVRVGDVTIGSQQSLNASAVLPPLLAEFRAAHPRINVHLTENSTSRGLAMISDGSLDIGLFHIEDDHETQGLRLDPLFEEELVLVAGGEQANEATGDVGSLSQRTFIAFSQGAMLRRRLEQLCRDAGFAPHIAYECDALASVRALASAGLGIALLPLPAVKSPGPPVQIVPVGLNAQRTIYLVRSEQHYQSNAARALATLLQSALSLPRDGVKRVVQQGGVTDRRE